MRVKIGGRERAEFGRAPVNVEEGPSSTRSRVLVPNIRVVALHESFGFRRESYLREHIRRPDGPVDVVGLALLRRDWEMTRPGIEQMLKDRGMLQAAGEGP